MVALYIYCSYIIHVLNAFSCICTIYLYPFLGSPSTDRFDPHTGQKLEHHTQKKRNFHFYPDLQQVLKLMTTAYKFPVYIATTQFQVESSFIHGGSARFMLTENCYTKTLGHVSGEFLVLRRESAESMIKSYRRRCLDAESLKDLYIPGCTKNRTMF